MSNNASRIVQIMPAPGWRVWMLEDGVLHDYPVAGWALYEDGQILAMYAHSNGDMEEAFYEKGFVAVLPDGIKPNERMLEFARLSARRT